MGELHTFFKLAELIFSNPAVLFFIVFLASEWCFGYLQPLLLKSNGIKIKRRMPVSAMRSPSRDLSAGDGSTALSMLMERIGANISVRSMV